MKKRIEVIKSAIFGLAVADALGVPVEFSARESLDKNPVEDMIGYGTYNMPEGCWSDDTSMAICALDSLAGGYVDYDEIMRNFVDWCCYNKYTPTDYTFDMGNACRTAIMKFKVDGVSPLECGGITETSNGNGSLMRIIPFVLYHIYADKEKELLPFIHDASSLTHAHMRSKIACGIYAIIVEMLIENNGKQAVIKALKFAKNKYKDEPELKYYNRIFEEAFSALPRDEIKSTGYVVDTLEAAIWCLLTTDSYKDCVLKAVNLGTDTDTVAAVAGGLAGIMYGYEGIPETWLGKIKKRDFLEEMCVRAGETWRN